MYDALDAATASNFLRYNFLAWPLPWIFLFFNFNEFNNVVYVTLWRSWWTFSSRTFP